MKKSGVRQTEFHYGSRCFFVPKLRSGAARRETGPPKTWNLQGSGKPASLGHGFDQDNGVSASDSPAMQREHNSALPSRAGLRQTRTPRCRGAPTRLLKHRAARRETGPPTSPAVLRGRLKGLLKVGRIILNPPGLGGRRSLQRRVRDNAPYLFRRPLSDCLV